MDAPNQDHGDKPSKDAPPQVPPKDTPLKDTFPKENRPKKKPFPREDSGILVWHGNGLVRLEDLRDQVENQHRDQVNMFNARQQELLRLREHEMETLGGVTTLHGVAMDGTVWNWDGEKKLYVKEVKATSGEKVWTEEEILEYEAKERAINPQFRGLRRQFMNIAKKDVGAGVEGAGTGEVGIGEAGIGEIGIGGAGIGGADIGGADIGGADIEGAGIGGEGVAMGGKNWEGRVMPVIPSFAGWRRYCVDDTSAGGETAFGFKGESKEEQNGDAEKDEGNKTLKKKSLWGLSFRK